MFKRLLFFLLFPLCFWGCLSCSAVKQSLNRQPLRYLTASRIGMIPNSIAASKTNASIIAKVANQGYGIIVDDVFYIGKSDVVLEKDFFLQGMHKGGLIMTTNLSWSVVNSIHVNISKLSVGCNMPVSSSSQIRLIENKGNNYHPSILIEDCIIDGVRIYSHVAGDVDQENVKDGVKEFTFRRNLVTNTGNYVVKLTNCMSDNIFIEDNIINNFKSIVFGLNLTNGFRDVGFTRLKNVFFNRNQINNEGFAIDEAVDYNYIYHTPIIVESDFCECKDNIFKSIICKKTAPIAVYPFYLSSRQVVISGNSIVDCLNLSNSINNELFKCKQSPRGALERVIENNRCLVTPDCLKLRAMDEIPYIRMCGFQSKIIGSIIIRNNTIDVACDFVFGAAVQCEYQYFEFSDNSVKYRNIGPTSRQLLRLLPSSNSTGVIRINNNSISSVFAPSSLYSLFDYDYSGYTIEVLENHLSGLLPYGSVGGSICPSASVITRNNTIDLGSFNSLVRIPSNISAKDIFMGGRHGFAIRLIGEPSNGVHMEFGFVTCAPESITSQNNTVNNQSVMITTFNDEGEKKKYANQFYNGDDSSNKSNLIKCIHIDM